jgi:DNA replication protein
VSEPLFKGFSAGRHSTIPLPVEFFTDLLPHVHHVGALHVILFTFRALVQREGDYRYLTRRDYARETTLQRAMGADFDTALTEALAELVRVGALLPITIAIEEREDTLYFVNSARGRAAVAQIERGQWQPGWDERPVDILPERPNLYQFYEDNIGPLTPHLADELRHAEGEYPPLWIEDAIKEASEQNKRSWRYIRAILERWRQEGKNFHAKPAQDHSRTFPRPAGSPASSGGLSVNDDL